MSNRHLKEWPLINEYCHMNQRSAVLAFEANKAKYGCVTNDYPSPPKQAGWGWVKMTIGEEILSSHDEQNGVDCEDDVETGRHVITGYGAPGESFDQPTKKVFKKQNQYARCDNVILSDIRFSSVMFTIFWRLIISLFKILGESSLGHILIRDIMNKINLMDSIKNVRVSLKETHNLKEVSKRRKFLLHSNYLVERYQDFKVYGITRHNETINGSYKEYVLGRNKKRLICDKHLIIPKFYRQDLNYKMFFLISYNHQERIIDDKMSAHNSGMRMSFVTCPSGEKYVRPKKCLSNIRNVRKFLDC
jgi:hypothetical protein